MDPRSWIATTVRKKTLPSRKRDGADLRDNAQISLCPSPPAPAPPSLLPLPPPPPPLVPSPGVELGLRVEVVDDGPEDEPGVLPAAAEVELKPGPSPA